MICSSSPLRRAQRVYPPSGKAKRTRPSRARLVSLCASRKRLGSEEVGRGDRALISNRLRASNFGAGEVLQGSMGGFLSNPVKRYHARFVGRRARAGKRHGKD